MTLQLHSKFNHQMTKLLPFLISLLCFVTACSSGFKEQDPNVIVIVADDLGYHDLSFTGSEFYETPNIDELAKNSVQFSSAYASSPVCSPARASIITGQFPSRHGITDWIGALTGEAWRSHNRHTKMLPAPNLSVLDTAHVTLPEAMRHAGYTTFIAGKWHIGGVGSAPEDHGFDINVGAWEKGSPIGGYFDPYQNPRLDNRSSGESLPFRLADETVSFIHQYGSEQNNQPFFAYLSFYSVHSPLQSSREKWQKYRNKADSLGIEESGFVMGDRIPVRVVQDHPVYAGLIEHMDEAIGHLIEELKQADLFDNTVIMFTSDHGGVSSGDHFSTTNLPLRAGKGSTFEGGIRVPFFVTLPNQIYAGKIIDTPVISTDIYPTLLDLTNQKLREEQHIDGKSLMPLIHGNSISERSLIWHYPHYSNQDGRPSSAIRKGNWKLIYDHETKDSELYNLSENPSEGLNIFDKYPTMGQQLYNLLMSHLTETAALFPKPDPAYDPQKEQLYLQWMRDNRLKTLEQQRLRFLSNEFSPNSNWWGSQSSK